MLDTFFFLNFSNIDRNKEKYVNALKEAVAVQSVSASPEKREDTIKMVFWFAERLKKLGAEIELCDAGSQVRHSLLYY